MSKLNVFFIREHEKDAKLGLAAVGDIIDFVGKRGIEMNGKKYDLMTSAVDGTRYDVYSHAIIEFTNPNDPFKMKSDIHTMTCIGLNILAEELRGFGKNIYIHHEFSLGDRE